MDGISNTFSIVPKSLDTEAEGRIDNLPTILISGITWPLEQMPIPLQAISYLVPSSLTIKGFVSLTQAGTSLFSLSHWWVKLWLLAAFYFVLAMLRMYKLKGTRA